MEIAPDSDQVQRAAGIWKLNEYRFADAETAFRRAIEINPNNTSAYTNLALLYMCLNRHDEATALSQRSIELDPLVAITRMNHVLHLALSGRYDDAIKEAAQGIALAPENPFIYMNRAEAYEGKKMFTEAIADVQKACEIDKDNIDFRVVLAATYARTGDRARATLAP